MGEFEDEMQGSNIRDVTNYSDIVDPNCVAENPVQINFQDITSASYVIKSGIEYTPCSVNGDEYSRNC